MNTVTIIVGVERGKFIEKEFGTRNPDRYTFEVRKEDDGVWMYITVKDFGNCDALTLFHAGMEAGVASVRNTLLP